MEHGGDRYRNRVKTDFSVNVNPFGIPEGVKEALGRAAARCMEYPDQRSEQLTEAVAGMLGINEQYLLFGNGASELFMAVVHALSPKKTVIPVPSFSGYEYAAALSGEIVFHGLKEENGFALGKDLFDALDEKTDLLFLANPNNPAGGLVEREFLKELLRHCREREIRVVLDECFIEFCEKRYSFLPEVERYDNLILVRAFTKIFAIPGVRIGYLVSSNEKLTAEIGRQLPEWNISVFAQEAGAACTKERTYLEKTAEYVKRESRFLEEGLAKAGCRVFPHAAGFLMVYTEVPLYDRLLERGILIRDCSSFRGLAKGYYRIAVKNRAENEMLLKTIGEII